MRTRSYTSEHYGPSLGLGLKSSYQNDEMSRGSNAVIGTEPKNKVGTQTPLVMPQKFYECCASLSHSPPIIRKNNLPDI